MPVEIRELVIRAVVDADLGRVRGGEPGDEGAGQGEREAIVRACVRQVLRILEASRER
jgi:hypothetical protein